MGKQLDQLEAELDREIQALETEIAGLRAKVEAGELQGFDLGRALARLNYLPQELAALKARRAWRRRTGG